MVLFAVGGHTEASVLKFHEQVESPHSRLKIKSVSLEDTDWERVMSVIKCFGNSRLIEWGKSFDPVFIKTNTHAC